MAEAGSPSWLCRTDLERARLLDMERRLKPVRAAAMGVLALALIVCGPEFGFWTLVPLVVVAGLFALVGRGLDCRSRPEYWILAAWALSQLAIAISVVLTGGPSSPALLWLVVPIITLSARFGARGVGLGLGFTAALVLAVTVPWDPFDEGLLPVVVLTLAAIAAVVILSTALMRSDVEHRSDSIIDPLTGLLNRNRLAERFDELALQASQNGEPVGVIVADLDRFKRINDEHGHAQGDAVLKDVAYAMRKSLRSFDLIYRMGGEEFVVLLPGAGEEAAEVVAERLRLAVAEAKPAGLPVTVSLGVAAAAGDELDFQRLFDAADAALYQAKDEGRNRVVIAPAAGRIAEPIAA